jgi:gamma-glutamylcyclotransferase (GGCT)/AIG2-like uncharacterized protein YtfP
MMSKTESLFVYGTLRHTDVQMRLIGRRVVGRPHVLKGYCRYVDLGPYPVALPDDSSAMAGMILQISPEELDIIDHYEGDGYVRKQVELETGDTVWVYLGNPAYYSL